MIISLIYQTYDFARSTRARVASCRRGVWPDLCPAREVRPPWPRSSAAGRGLAAALGGRRRPRGVTGVFFVGKRQLSRCVYSRCLGPNMCVVHRAQFTKVCVQTSKAIQEPYVSNSILPTALSPRYYTSLSGGSIDRTRRPGESSRCACRLGCQAMDSLCIIYRILAQPLIRCYVHDLTCSTNDQPQHKLGALLRVILRARCCTCHA